MLKSKLNLSSASEICREVGHTVSQNEDRKFRELRLQCKYKSEFSLQLQQFQKQ